MPPKANPTHFLSIQLASGQLSRSLAAFRAEVTSPAQSPSVPDDAVRPPGTLHLTLGVMRLGRQTLPQAVSLLQHLEPRQLLSDLRATAPCRPVSDDNDDDDDNNNNNDGLQISLRGLHSTAASADRTSVLYAAPSDADAILYPFCEGLRRPFRDAGLIVDERPLLLHATVVNTVYARGQRRRGERLILDARDLLRRYDGHVWAKDVPLTRVALCRMGARKLDGGDEAYEVESEIAI